jgi:outer membrane protein OmpA-like peptidoglycan-associated protein
MKLSRLLILLNLFLSASFSAKETRTFLLNKNEYKYLETKNILIAKAIQNAFGSPDKQNYYKIDISKIDAWTIQIEEFRYYPVEKGSSKKSSLFNTVLGAQKNTSIKYRVTINKEKSSLHNAIKQYIDDNNSFILNVVILGDPKILVTEPADKKAFFRILDEKSFTEKAFTNFFGENPKNINYNIAFDKTNACLIKDLLTEKCEEVFNAQSYDKFVDKVTSPLYSSSYVLFDINVLRNRSNLTAAIEEVIFKEEDGTEHLRFYFCIPSENQRGKAKTSALLEGKIAGSENKPLKDQVIYLRNKMNVVIASNITDKDGTFKFEEVNEEDGLNLMIDNSCKEKEVFLLNKSGKVIGQYTKTAAGFIYKLLPAEIAKLNALEEIDPSPEFLTSIKGRMISVTDKPQPIVDQVIELKNNGNQLVSSQKTDKEGNFEFPNVDRRSNYTVELPQYTATTVTEKVYMANTKNELIREFKRDKNNKFSYKLLPADIQLLSAIAEENIEMTFSKQKSVNEKEIVIQDFIYYKTGSSEISQESKTTLDKIIKLLKENKAYKVDILSHTDSRGDNTANQKLSEKRSEAVMQYIISGNIETLRLKAFGLGESKPLNNCVDGVICLEEEYKMNRRTEFRFYK